MKIVRKVMIEHLDYIVDGQSWSERPQACPFCGSSGWRVEVDQHTLGEWVRCTKCLACGPIGVPQLTPKAGAMAVWNARTQFITDTRRARRNPCAICGFARHMAIHQPPAGKPDAPPIGHAYQPLETAVARVELSEPVPRGKVNEKAIATINAAQRERG